MPDNGAVPATLGRQRLDACLGPTQMLRALRDQAGLFGLLGAWHDSAAVVGFSPVRRLSAEEDPFAAMRDLPRVHGAGGFGGGWVGALGYQLGGLVERLPPAPPRPIPMPAFSLAYYDHVLVHDRGGWWFEALVDAGNRERIDGQLRLIQELLDRPSEPAGRSECGDFVGYPDGPGHRDAIRATLGHLTAGDIFQANVCRRFETEFRGDPLDAFCAGFERLGPRYGAFLRTPQGAIASFSPELFLRRKGRAVRTSPIKGTAPLESDVDELIASPKNRAENVMIVDLMRNDLGRVCLPGSVQVEDLARAERHTGVWHLVSDVVGELAPDEDDASLLRATFPPGSVTGAPKVRAMEVIHEVEATGRETYTGAIGYVSPRAGMELNVAIRTFEFAAGKVWLGAGGGVVVESTPQGELVETLVKAAPLVAAIGARLDAAERQTLAPADHERAPLLALPAAAATLPSVDPAAGLFTTLLVVDGRPVDLEPHLTRLATSVADCYGSSLPADLADRVRAMAARLLGRHRLRITVAPDSQGIGEPQLTSVPLAERSGAWRLVPVVIAGGLGPHKYDDRRRLDAVEPAKGTWSATCDALVSDCDGSLLETGRGNLFVVTDDAVHTPALDGRLLPGVTRQRVIEELEAVGIDVVLRRRITLDDLTDAAEVFVTGSLDGVRSVSSVDGAGGWDCGPTTAWLASRMLLREPSTRRVALGIRRRENPIRLLLIDNFDSFVYNLDQCLRELGAHTEVVRNDAIGVDEISSAVELGRVQGIIVSPGPGTPADAGVSSAVIEHLGASVPILGVCLGHQCIAEVYGARVVRAETVVHGKQSLVHHDGSGVFAGLSGPLLAGRYHSLVVSEQTLPPDLRATAHTAGGVLMGIRHRELAVEGIQIHPESILTRQGHPMLANFLRACGEAEVRDPHLLREGVRSRVE